MVKDAAGMARIEHNKSGAPLPTGDAAQATPAGAVQGELHIAGGAATDTLVASVERKTGAMEVMPTELGYTTLVSGTGHDSPLVGAGLDVVHVMGGQASGLDPVDGFQIGVADVHLVDFAATVAASAAQTDVENGGSPTDSAGAPRIDMVGIASLGVPG
jgi:hypothetical protein